MPSKGLAAAGGVCIGSGIAIGAHSDGWFLTIAIPLLLVGIGMVAGAFVRTATALSPGDPVPVTVDLVDRSASQSGASSTLIAGEAFPPGDAPFRFQTSAGLSADQLTDIVRDGRGDLPSGALGDRDSTPTTEHRTARGHAPAVLIAVATMWVTILLPPDDFWEMSWPSSSSSPAVPGAAAADSTVRPLWQWYDEAIAHVRAEAPAAVNSILDISIYDSYVQITTYLGGDEARVFEGRTSGWEVADQSTSLRERDTFSADDDLRTFSARDFLSRASAMLPQDQREPSRMEVKRNTDDIFGATRPVLAEGWFGEDSEITVEGTADGAVAPWWSADDLAAGLQQVGDALTARGVSAADPSVKEVGLRQGSYSEGAGAIEYYRGATYYRTGLAAGEFTGPDDKGTDSEFPRFRFSDIDSGVLNRVRDDAMRRYGIDPVDRGKAEITIAPSVDDNGVRQDNIVIEVDYTDAHGGTAIYSLAGTYLAEQTE